MGWHKKEICHDSITDRPILLVCLVFLRKNIPRLFCIVKKFYESDIEAYKIGMEHALCVKMSSNTMKPAFTE